MGDGEDLCSGRLLRDIEEISKALYVCNDPLKAINVSSDQHRNSHNAAIQAGILKSKSKVSRESSHKDKKSSIWNWKPLKALAHIRSSRFNCCFFLHVHSVEGLPSNFNKINLHVIWKHKGEKLSTRPASVCVGIAEFEETLMHKCTLYASRTGAHDAAKYEPKLFLLQTSVVEAPKVDIGKHWIDLTRLLPLTLEELEGDGRSCGKWTTSFKLTGMAKGAMLNVSFGFSVLDGNSFEPGYLLKALDAPRVGGPWSEHHSTDFGNSGTSQLHNLGSVLEISRPGSRLQAQPVDKISPDDIYANQRPEIAHSITVLYQKLDEQKLDNTEFDFSHEPAELLKLKSGHPLSEFLGGNTGPEYDYMEFTVVDQGVEMFVKDEVRIDQNGSQRFDSSLIETIDVSEIFKEEELVFDENVEWKLEPDNFQQDENLSAKDDEFKQNSCYGKEPTTEKFDPVLNDTLTPRATEFELLPGVNKYQEQESYSNTMSSNSKLKRSLSLDDIAESIENDFLNMLSIGQDTVSEVSDIDPDSAKDNVSRNFQDNSIDLGSHVLGTNLMEEQNKSCCLLQGDWGTLEDADDIDLSLAIHAVEKNDGSLAQSLRSKRNAKMLEKLETQSLMHKWGLNENPFQNSPHASSGGFGSPVYVPAEEPLKLPSLGENLGPIVRTRDGGFLRSINPLLFVNAKYGARLILQVSAPVVLPAAMGCTAMEVLQCWAAGGVEKMSAQAKELMPLEDITGKTIRQVVSEAESGCTSQQESKVRLQSIREEMVAQSSDSLCSCSFSENVESECTCFENLVPTALSNLEGLSIEGLKIQSGMPNQEAPSSIRIQFSGNSASVSETIEPFGNFDSERPAGLQVLAVDELVNYSLSLEKWMRLDSGDFDANDEIDESILKVLAAHRAKHIDLISEQLREEDKTVRLLNSRCGVLSNNFMLALRVQLRDPLRNYESVGCSMLALIQVERVCPPLESGQQHTTPDGTCEVEVKTLGELLNGETSFEQKQNMSMKQFKILEVNLAGLNVLAGHQQLCLSTRHQQSGSRWLLSSGLAGTNKHSFLKSNAIVRSSSRMITKARNEDVLWSISSRTQGEAAVWSESIALNVHVRNPDIII